MGQKHEVGKTDTVGSSRRTRSQMAAGPKLPTDRRRLHMTWISPMTAPRCRSRE